MNHKKTHHANLHGFYVKNYKPNPYLVQNDQMGNILSDLLDKGVSSLQTLASKELNKVVTNVTGQVNTVANNVANATGTSTNNTTTTNIVAQPMSDFQKYGLMLGAGFVGIIGVVALVKALK